MASTIKEYLEGDREKLKKALKDEGNVPAYLAGFRFLSPAALRELYLGSEEALAGRIQKAAQGNEPDANYVGATIAELLRMITSLHGRVVFLEEQLAQKEAENQPTQ